MNVKSTAPALLVALATAAVGLQRPAHGQGADSPAIEKDISYSPDPADGGDERKLDLYLPGSKNFSTIVFTYGGGWHTGSRKSVAPIGEKLASLGFGVALLSHRLGPKDLYPAQIEDVAAGFAWVAKHIAEKGGDPKRVFLMGHSSGAHLSLLLASDPRFLAPHGLSRANVRGVVGLSTPVDLEPRPDGRGFGDTLMAGRGAETFSRSVDVLKDASPIRHVSKDLPPVLLVAGENDFPMLAGDAERFVAKAKEAGAAVTSFVAKGKDHMGVVGSLLEETSPTREAVLAFLHALEN